MCKTNKESCPIYNSMNEPNSDIGCCVIDSICMICGKYFGVLECDDNQDICPECLQEKGNKDVKN